MSGDEGSEEKTQQASSRKLKKAREKGTVVTSKDTITSIVAIAALIFIYVRLEDSTEKFMALWQLEIDPERGFWLTLQDKGVLMFNLGLQLVLPLTALVISVSILTGMMVSGGPLFAPNLIAPNFDRINPASGFKRLFALKAMQTFAMHLIRLTALLLVFGLILSAAWSAMIRAPVCGLGCAMETMQSVALPMVIGAVAVMVVMAIFDYIVQRHAFMKDQMMTQTEFKKEIKEQMGDPHLRGQLKQDRKQILQSMVGAKHAILIVRAGNDRAVGVTFIEGETPAPVVVAKARGGPAIRKLINAAPAIEVEDAELARDIHRITVGGYVSAEATILNLVPHIQRAIMASSPSFS